MNASNYSHLPYRLGVGAMVLNADGLVFAGQRIDTRADAWQMPQGGIDVGEDPKAAVFRELEEETGITPDHVTLLAETSDWLTYDLPEHLIPELWSGQYRGQQQKWYLMRFLGDDSDINIQTAIPEFLSWKWVAMKSLPEMIVPFKQPLYHQLVHEFSSLA